MSFCKLCINFQTAHKFHFIQKSLPTNMIKFLRNIPYMNLCHLSVASVKVTYECSTTVSWKTRTYSFEEEHTFYWKNAKQSAIEISSSGYIKLCKNLNFLLKELRKVSSGLVCPLIWMRWNASWPIWSFAVMFGVTFLMGREFLYWVKRILFPPLPL